VMVVAMPMVDVTVGPATSASAAAFVGNVNPLGANTNDAARVPVALNAALNDVVAYVSTRSGRSPVVAYLDDHNTMLSVDVGPVEVIPIVVPANGPINEISSGIVNVVFDAAPANVPNNEPNDGFVFHVTVPSAHVVGSFK